MKNQTASSSLAFCALAWFATWSDAQYTEHADEHEIVQSNSLLMTQATQAVAADVLEEDLERATGKCACHPAYPNCVPDQHGRQQMACYNPTNGYWDLNCCVPGPDGCGHHGGQGLYQPGVCNTGYFSTQGQPQIVPTVAPTVTPTVAPTVAPTVTPTVAPTEAPTYLTAAAAAEKLRQLRADGNNDTSCRGAAEGIKATVIHAVRGLQNALDALENGSSCADLGASMVDALQVQHEEAVDDLESAEAANEDAKDKKVSWTYHVTEVAPPKSDTAVANLIRTDTDYLAALAALTASESAATAANATVSSVAAALANAETAQQSSVKDCQCRVRKKYEQELADVTESHADFSEDWSLAAHLLCALDGTADEKCSVPPVPTVELPQLHQDVQKLDVSTCP